MPEVSVESRIRSFAALGYDREHLARVRESLLVRSYPAGCPTAFVDLRPGQTLVDIGAGNGLDCTLLRLNGSPQARLIGVDLSWSALRTASSGNGTRTAMAVGDGDSLPIADAAADWVVANGLFCLLPDPERSCREVFRVLRPGGKLAVGLLLTSLPGGLAKISRWLSGIQPGRSESGYREMLTKVGFRDIRVERRHAYELDQVRHLWGSNPAIRRLLEWSRARACRPVAERILDKFAGLDLVATKSMRDSERD